MQKFVSRLVRFASAAVLVVSPLLVAPTLVSACSCIGGITREQAFADTPAVFAATVTSVSSATSVFGYSGLRVDMLVDTSWKGNVYRDMAVSTNGDSAGCGYAFTEGERYLVYAHEDPENGQLSVNLCSRTMPASTPEAAEDMAAMGEGTRLDAGPNGGAPIPPEAEVTPDDSGATQTAGAIVVSAILATLVFIGAKAWCKRHLPAD